MVVVYLFWSSDGNKKCENFPSEKQTNLKRKFPQDLKESNKKMREENDHLRKLCELIETPNLDTKEIWNILLKDDIFRSVLAARKKTQKTVPDIILGV